MGQVAGHGWCIMYIILYLGWAVYKIIVNIHRTPMCMYAFCVYVSAIE